jgi:hypothetical protein
MKKISSCILGISLTLVACLPGKDKGGDSSGTNSDTTNGQQGDPNQAEKYKPGVSGQKAEADAVAVAGTLALTMGLTDGPDTVLAFRSSNGEYAELGNVIEAPVDADGKFSLSLSQANPKLERIAAAKKPDGTFDRDAISEIVGEPVDPSTTDKQIQDYLDQQESAAKDGGVTYTLVAMKKSGDRVAEAQTFQFIGMAAAGSVINGLPISDAKGDIGLGTISGDGDQATSELELSEDVFDVSMDTLQGMAAASKALKIIKNQWMNYHDDGSSYRVTPFYMWSGSLDLARGKFTEPGVAPFSGMGMYLGVRNTGLKFEDICGSTAKAITLAPPADIDAGMAGTINKDRPFSNSGLGAIHTESTRSNCNGSDTGFYGAGQPGKEDLMINWGTGGSVTNIVEGLWDFQVDGVTKANFEMASSSPLDVDGHPIVFIPSARVTMANGAVSKVEVELYRYDSDSASYVKLEDLSAFKRAASDINVELSSRSDGGNSVDERVSLFDHIDGSVMSVQGSDYEHTFADDGQLSIAIYYEMFGGSYRLELRKQN